MRRFHASWTKGTGESGERIKYHLYRRPNKKTGAFWMDVRIDGVRYREPLGTRDRGEAGELMHKRIEQLKSKPPAASKTVQVFRVNGHSDRDRSVHP